MTLLLLPTGRGPGALCDCVGQAGCTVLLTLQCVTPPCMTTVLKTRFYFRDQAASEAFLGENPIPSLHGRARWLHSGGQPALLAGSVFSLLTL